MVPLLRLHFVRTVLQQADAVWCCWRASALVVPEGSEWAGVCARPCGMGRLEAVSAQPMLRDSSPGGRHGV